MSRHRDLTAAGPRPEVQPAICAYCGAPLADAQASTVAGKAGKADALPRYCCYGCRILGEGSRRPLEMAAPTNSPWFKIAVGAVLAGQSMLVGLGLNLAPPDGLVRWSLHGALLVSSLAVLLILGGPLLDSAILEIRRRRITIELLFLAGILGALAASLQSTVTGRGPVYYEVIGILLTVYAVGRTLGAESRARALAETRQLQRLFETCQRILPDGSTRIVPVGEIKPGNRVRVLPGEPISIDGYIDHGQAFVCETPLTGEPFPVVRREGDAVMAGSYSEDGELRITATQPGSARSLDQLLASLNAARERTCRLQAQADALVSWFLPLVLVVAMGTFLFWTWRAGWPMGLFNAMAVLLVACPCAMGLATPLALWGGLASLASRGLVARGGDEIERLALLDQMVLDKTGTLSEEQFRLVDLATAGSREERQRMTAQLRAVEAVSSHPVARAFHNAGASPEASTFTVRSLKSIPGLGIEAWIEGADEREYHVRVGQREILSSSRGETLLLSQLRHTSADHLIYVEVDGQLGAIAAVRERLRDSAREAMQGLEQLGIACSIMTGDRLDRARQLLGHQDIQGHLTPSDKADSIAARMRAGHQVGFVGDGVNDGPAIRAASVGIALAHGAGVATANAGLVLYGGDLRVLPWAVDLCRRLRESLQANLVFAAVYNLLGMALAACGLLHPVAAALLMLVSSFTVSWRAWRGAECGFGCPTEASQEESPISWSRRKPKARTRWLVLQGLTNINWAARWLSPWIAGVLLVAQAPFLVYLSRCGPVTAIGLWIALLAVGLGVGKFRPRHRELAHAATMTWAMLGWGNWGMLLGWWADAGFAPVATCCAQIPQHGFQLLGFTEMPWMNLGMLLLGLPPMLTGPEKAYRGLGRLSTGILAAVGMVWGMSYGSHVSLLWLGPSGLNPVILSYGGMTLGMLLGMFLCCELGRAIAAAARPGNSCR